MLQPRDGDMLAKFMFSTNVKKVVNRMPKIQYATDLEKIAVDERRAEGNYERDKSILWRLLYQNHLALQESLLFNPEKLTLFGRSVVATPPSTPRRPNACSKCARKTREKNAKDLGLITLGNIRDKNAKENTKAELQFNNKLWMEKLKELLDCMPGSDGSLPLKEIQKRAEEEKQREARLAAMRRKHRKSLTRSSSGPLLPKIVVRDEKNTDSYQSGTFFRSSRGRSRFHTDLSDTYIPPRVLTLKINRPETVAGRFSRVRINEDKTNQGSTRNGEDTEKSDHQNQKDMEESNVLTGGKAGDEESTQDDEEHLPVATNSANQVKFKSVSVSDRGMRFVPIHLIKHQTAPLVTEEMIQEQKILRQKYLSKKDCHCYRDFIAQENVPGLRTPGKARINISAEMRRQIRKHSSSIVGRDIFALPVELTREFHVFKLQAEREMKQKDGTKSTERVKSAPTGRNAAEQI